MSNFTKQVSLHGKRAYVSDQNELVAKKGFVAGGEDSIGRQGGNVVFPGPDVVSQFEDFLDTAGSGYMFVTSDTGPSTGAGITSTNGVFRLTLAANPLTLANATCVAVSTNTMKNWKANQGGGPSGTLRFSTRCKLESVSRTIKRQYLYAGFSDSGGAETPFFDTGGAQTANAADLVGFAVSPQGDTGYVLVACQGGGTPQVVATGVSPTANTYDVLELAIQRDPGDTGGSVYGYINGKLVGVIRNPVTSSVALAPRVGFWGQDTGPRTMDIDYINVSAPRDTGN